MIQIIHPDGRILYLDSTFTMTVNEEAVPALHPIEDGSPAADHVEKQPINLNISGVLTENPTGAQEDYRAGDPSKQDVMAGLTGPARLEAALDFLRNGVVGEFVDIVSGRFWYESYLLASWPHEWDINQSHPISLSFTKARRVSVATAAIPPSKAQPATMQKEKNKGQGSLQDVDKSGLENIAEGIGWALNQFTGGS